MRFAIIHRIFIDGTVRPFYTINRYLKINNDLKLIITSWKTIIKCLRSLIDIEYFVHGSRTLVKCIVTEGN